MARGHGRILTSVWEDTDFLALTQEQQRLYLFLISQPNLNHAGLLPLTLRRWAGKAAGLTPAALDAHLAALAAARFIVMDEDTEELLIRSFVRNDGVWKQPKVMGAMTSGAMEISSRALRAALLAEMDRIPLGELSDEPTKYRGADGPSIREQVADHIEALRKAFGNPTATPTEGGSTTPSAPPSASPSDTPDEGGREGSTRGRARPRPRVSPAPAPSPTPAPEQRGGGPADDHTAPETPAGALAPIDADGFEITDGMRRWATRDGYAALIDIDHATQQFVSHYRATGAHRKSWPDAWQKWIRDDAKRAADRAPTPTSGTANGWQPYQDPQDLSVYENGF